jgi:hypothetical protein
MQETYNALKKTAEIRTRHTELDEAQNAHEQELEPLL